MLCHHSITATQCSYNKCRLKNKLSMAFKNEKEPISVANINRVYSNLIGISISQNNPPKYYWMKVEKKRELLTASNFSREAFNKTSNSWGTSKEMDRIILECPLYKFSRGLQIMLRHHSMCSRKFNNTSRLKSKELFLPIKQAQIRSKEIPTSLTI